MQVPNNNWVCPVILCNRDKKNLMCDLSNSKREIDNFLTCFKKYGIIRYLSQLKRCPPRANLIKPSSRTLTLISWLGELLLWTFRIWILAMTFILLDHFLTPTLWSPESSNNSIIPCKLLQTWWPMNWHKNFEYTEACHPDCLPVMPAWSGYLTEIESGEVMKW